MSRWDTDISAFDYFDNIGFNQVKLWEHQFSKKSPTLEKLISEINLLHTDNDASKWIKIMALELSNKLIYWYNFFSTFGIKIHLDAQEWGTNIIVKQIAIRLLDEI